MPNTPFSAARQSLLNQEARARRAARSVGLRAIKSRSHVIDNAGQFQLIDRYGCVQAGHGYELTADDVLEFCRRWPEESKFAFGASMQRYSAVPNPAVTEIEVATIPPAMPAAPQTQLLQPETGHQISDVEMETYRLVGFLDGPKQLDSDQGLFTFEEIYKELGYKKVSGLKALLERLKYPPLVIEKERLTALGIQILKTKRQEARDQQKKNSRKRTKKKKQKRRRKSEFGQRKHFISETNQRTNRGQIETNRRKSETNRDKSRDFSRRNQGTNWDKRKTNDFY